MTENKRILIGEIATAHGIKGYVKVRCFAEDETLLEGEDVFIAETGAAKIRLKLKNEMKGHWLAEVKGVSDRNEAERLRGRKLYIERSALPDTDDGEYYIEDLKGLKVFEKDGKEIGTALSVVNFGASDLLHIKPPVGESFYIPFTDDTIIGVDLKMGAITVDMPEAF